jgi:dephospho-CoA kinase
MSGPSSIIIGITGQIGSGKSSVAELLRQAGAIVIDADRIGRQVVERSAALRRKLVRAFGAEIITPSGRLRRRKLAELAFASRENQRLLNGLVHPYLLAELKRRLRQARKRSRPVVVDAALLLDWNLDSEMDLVWLVHAPRPLRLARLAARGIARADALAREKVQLPVAAYRARADRVIPNNGSMKDLAARVKPLAADLISQTR